MLVFVERGKPEYPEKKTSWSKDENQEQIEPTYDAKSRNRTRAKSVEGKGSHHYSTRSMLTKYGLKEMPVSNNKMMTTKN